MTYFIFGMVGVKFKVRIKKRERKRKKSSWEPNCCSIMNTYITLKKRTSNVIIECDV
jgi:hypothetical protein